MILIVRGSPGRTRRAWGSGATVGAFAGEEGVRAAYRLLVGVDPENGQLTVRSDGATDGAVLIDPGAMMP